MAIEQYQTELNCQFDPHRLRQNLGSDNMKMSGTSPGQSASELISTRIAELDDWRGETLGRMRKFIRESDPDVVEEWKWMGTPVWSHDGIICTGESYKDKVKLTFAKGAFLNDPAGCLLYTSPSPRDS